MSTVIKFIDMLHKKFFWFNDHDEEVASIVLAIFVICLVLLSLYISVL